MYPDFVRVAVPAYFLTYTDRVRETDVRDVLESEIEPALRVFGGLGEDAMGFRYAEGKWSLKELLGHLVDAERVFQWRALCFAREDRPVLPGFSEDDYVTAGGFDERSGEGLCAEFRTVRQATLTLFDGLPDRVFERSGVANGLSMPVAVIPWILAGHQRHHLGVVGERYLPGLDEFEVDG